MEIQRTGRLASPHRFCLWAFAVCALLVIAPGCRSFYAPPAPAAAPGMPATGTTIPAATMGSAPAFGAAGIAADPLAPVFLPGSLPPEPAAIAATPNPGAPLTTTDPTAPASPGVPSLANAQPPVFDAGALVDTPPPGATILGAPAPTGGPLAVAPPVPSQSSLSLTPSRLVAPVGSEVVLLAGVIGDNGQPAPNARVEWMLSPDSAGQLLKVGKGCSWNLLHHLHNKPRKIDNNYAVSNTASQMATLTPGGQNVRVARGQTWITLSSPTDGVSHVTAYAPNVSNWDNRKQTASIYWVDGQFSYPSPAVVPVGTRQPLSTTVTRSSDGTPVEGWLVRYEVTTGDGAGFAPDGASAVEVMTDPSGMANVELFQTQPGRGTTQVSIQVIRPNVPGEGGSRRLAIGRGMTTVTWTAAEVAMRVTGPAQANAGGSATFRIEVSNAGSLPVEDVTVSSRPPRGMTYQRSSATVSSAGDTLQWKLGQLPPGATQTIDVDMRCDSAGLTEFCAEVSAANGPSARQCATIDIAAAPAAPTASTLEIQVAQVNAGSPIRVGDEVTYNIKITNRGNTPVSNAEITIAYDEGLTHEAMDPGTQEIKTKLGGLGVGESRDDLDVTFRTTKAGQLCHTVSVVATEAKSKEIRTCVNVTPAAAGGNVPPRNGAGSPGLDINSTGPRVRKVGTSAIFETTLTNTGSATLSNVRIEVALEQSLQAKNASRGFREEGGTLVWNIPRIDPGRSSGIKVEALCLEIDENACMNITVTADPGVVMGEDACVAIEAADPLDNNFGGGAGEPDGSQLFVEMFTLGAQFPVDGNVTYEVRITNRGNQPDRNVVLTVRVPQGLSPLEVTEGAPARHTIDGQEIRFEPIQEIRKGEAIEPFRIVVRALQPGRHMVVASVTSEREITPVISQQETNVFAN